MTENIFSYAGADGNFRVSVSIKSDNNTEWRKDTLRGEHWEHNKYLNLTISSVLPSRL